MTKTDLDLGHDINVDALGESTTDLDLGCDNHVDDLGGCPCVNVPVSACDVLYHLVTPHVHRSPDTHITIIITFSTETHQH